MMGHPAMGIVWLVNRPVRIIVPIVGSTNDVLARMVAPKLQEAIGGVSPAAYAARRNSDGELPLQARNARVKLFSLPNPAAAATCLIGLSVR